MLNGLQAYNTSFLNDLNDIQSRIARENVAISSGKRVLQASDDPSAVPAILSYQSEIRRMTQVQTNLNTAKTNATSADGALQSASQLMDQLMTIASQGASSTTTATTRQQLAQQVQQIQTELVGIANTQVGGQYIFGGDAPDTQPYSFNWSNSEGVVAAVANPTSTTTLEDASGNAIVPSMTAQQIFDAKNPGGTPASGNVFNAVYTLGQALQSSDQTVAQAGAQSAISMIQAASSQISQADSQYGNTENWITNATTYATQRLTDLQTSLSSVQDTDLAAAATQLTTDNTALQAAISAHATLSNKSLFDYLG